MRRGYTKEAYLTLVDQIRSILPTVALSSDFIAGFCTETDEDHRDTLDVINRVRYNFLYSFPYSMREKTKAHYHLTDDVTMNTKSRRHLEIHELFRQHAHEINQSYIGQTQLCLVEGPSKRAPESELAARNDFNTRVIFSKQLPNSTECFQPGDYVQVRIDTATSQSLKGTPIKRTTLSEFKSSISNATFNIDDNTVQQTIRCS
jgi:tRNA A37 methylthiotransferase MiaB